MNLNFLNTKFYIGKIFTCISIVLLTSCDPTIDSLSYDLPEAGDKVDETLPTAFFTYGQEEAWYRIKFANGTSNASNYQWDFGDGTELLNAKVPFIQDPVTLIEEQGLYDFPLIDEVVTYTVTLTVTDNNGESAVYTDQVTITPDPDFVIPINYDDFSLINTGDSNDPVVINSFTKEETAKGNLAANTLDGDIASLWAVNDAEGDGEYIIYDLGSSYDLTLIRLNFLTKTEAYGYQILTSTTGVSDADFSMIIPESGELEYTIGSGIFVDFEVTSSARYVKLVVYGRFDPTSFAKKSDWTNVNEVQFYEKR